MLTSTEPSLTTVMGSILKIVCTSIKPTQMKYNLCLLSLTTHNMQARTDLYQPKFNTHSTKIYIVIHATKKNTDSYNYRIYTLAMLLLYISLRYYNILLRYGICLSKIRYFWFHFSDDDSYPIFQALLCQIYNSEICLVCSIWTTKHQEERPVQGSMNC